MAQPPLRPCNAVSCKKVHHNVNGYCNEHDPGSWSSDNVLRKRGGSTTKWNRLRKTVFKRDSHLCVHCHANGILTEAVQVDHIVPISSGGSDELSNLESLCKPCHDEKTLAEIKEKLKTRWSQVDE